MKLCSLVCVLLLVSVLFFHSFTVSANFIGIKNNIDVNKIFSYNSFLDLSYDTSPFEDPVPLNKTVTIPITVEYWTDLPNFFSWFPFVFLTNLFLFGQMNTPELKIQIDIPSTPDWANIVVSAPEINISDIPVKSQGRMSSTTNINITLTDEAPALPQKMNISATCDTIGRINGSSYQETIFFTPAFNPCLQIDGPDILSFNKTNSKNVSVTVTNCGNGACKIIPSSRKEFQNFSINISPSFQDLSIDENKTFQIDITPQIYKEMNSSLAFKFRIESLDTTQSSSVWINDYVLTTQIIKDENNENDLSLFYYVLVSIALIFCFLFFLFMFNKYKKQ